MLGDSWNIVLTQLLPITTRLQAVMGSNCCDQSLGSPMPESKNRSFIA
jgi:hypothetical protein